VSTRAAREAFDLNQCRQIIKGDLNNALRNVRRRRGKTTYHRRHVGWASQARSGDCADRRTCGNSHGKESKTTMCTIMGATGSCTTDATVWLASTSDNPYAEGPRKPVALTIAGNGRRIIHTPCLKRANDGSLADLGSDRGLNDAGLAWTRSWVVPDEMPVAGALPAAEWFMRLGAECATVTEALLFIESSPRGPGSQGNYLLADAQGVLACAEVGYRSFTVTLRCTPPDGGSAARVNRFEDVRMLKVDASAAENPVYFATSESRHARAVALLRENCGRLDLATWQSILGDTRGMTRPPQTEHGASICSVGRTHGTVSAEIVHPSSGTFHYIYGWPNAAVVGTLLPVPVDPPLQSWRTWRAFRIFEMEEPGAYTTWSGDLTPVGKRYLGGGRSGA
jgi:hypothetical protein